MQQHGSKYFCRHTLGAIGQNSTFSEHGHVAYQIKGNHKCSNLVANILLPDTPPDPEGEGKRSKRIFITWSCCMSN